MSGGTNAQMLNQLRNRQNTFTYTEPNTLEQRQPEKIRKRPVFPPTEFEQMVADSIGQKLPIFGMSLFENGPTTFAPLTDVPVPNDYVIGPGDEIDVRVWGPVTINSRTTVNRNGEIYVPQVGNISVVGVQYSKLESRLKTELNRVFKNFELAATLGRLRTVKVFVVGEAADPGEYTVSSLSTLVTAIFASGGPSPYGSLRRIQLKRGDTVVAELDLYQLLLHGDKSKDVPIQPGDVIFYPPSGGYVALVGSVAQPAIYESKTGLTMADLISEAGGPTEVADNERILVERIDAKQARSATELTAEQAKNALVQKGDIVRIQSVVPRFDNVVTLRGNVANPGRYEWKQGMRILDLIPNTTMLLTREYWLNQANLISGRATEYPVKTATRPSSDAAGTDAKSKDDQSVTENTKQDSDTKTESNTTPNTVRNTAPKKTPDETNLAIDIRNSAPDINWDYALIQRVNPVDLTTQLIPFNLGRTVIEKDPAGNVPLQSGDIVTIFSQREMAVPQDRRTRFVKIDGEVRAPGVYGISPRDTLRSVVERAGGLTSNAYLYGSQLTRVSVQQQQQKSLDDFVALVTAQLQQATAAAVNGNPDQAASIKARSAEQQQVLKSFLNISASGRIVLEVPPTSESIDDIPEISLEDGDRFTVPHRPAIVTVIGSVYNQGSFLYRPQQKMVRYVNLAGSATPIADKRRMYVIRADGAVLSKTAHNGNWKGSFENYRLYPGDTIVVPSKLAIGSVQRNLREWTQIISQIALTAASLAVVAKQ